MCVNISETEQEANPSTPAPRAGVDLVICFDVKDFPDLHSGL
jgi:hypothetical protein